MTDADRQVIDRWRGGQPQITNSFISIYLNIWSNIHTQKKKLTYIHSDGKLKDARFIDTDRHTEIQNKDISNTNPRTILQMDKQAQES